MPSSLSLQEQHSLSHQSASPAELAATAARSTQQSELKALLEQQTPEQIMAQCSPLSAYLLCKELGLLEADQLLLAASAEQWLACIDLDCWHQDVPDLHDVDAWLAPFAERQQLDELAHLFGQLDESLQILMLQSRLRVYEVDNAPEPCDAWPKQWASPCGTLLLCGQEEQQLEVSTELLIHALYAVDVGQARRLLLATWSELPSQLQEEAYCARQSRLDELGFPSLAEAAGLYGPPKHYPAMTAGRQMPSLPEQRPSLSKCMNDEPNASQLPHLYRQVWDQAPLLQQLLRAAPEPAALQETIQTQWLRLIGCSLICHRGAIQQLQGLTLHARHILDLLQLALCYQLGIDELKQTLKSQQIQQGLVLLQQVPLRDLIGMAAHQLRPIQQQAQSLLASPILQQWLTEQDAGDGDDHRAAIERILQGLADPILPKRLIQSQPGQWREVTWQWPKQLHDVATQLRRIASSLSPEVPLR